MKIGFASRRGGSEFVSSAPCFVTATGWGKWRLHAQHMQKALTQMNLQIHHVLSDITGRSGLAILDAIVEGERNPAVSAQLRYPQVQASAEVVLKSLVGDYRREHPFTLRQSLEAYRYYQDLITRGDQEMEEQLQNFDRQLPPDAPDFPPEADPHSRRKNEFHFDMRSELYRIFGVDLTAIPSINALTGHTPLAEVGTDWSKSQHRCLGFLDLRFALTIRRTEGKFSLPKPAGLPVA
jgi:transposase